ncbi:MAG: hypothetical protein MZV63_41455 [Marinilabiliales bacterium]|nr:hypothetical protein [Marinilabiliales bacterium]
MESRGAGIPAKEEAVRGLLRRAENDEHAWAPKLAKRYALQLEGASGRSWSADKVAFSEKDVNTGAAHRFLPRLRSDQRLFKPGGYNMTLRRKVYMIAGYNTISMGTGRKEFHPKKERPGLEEYMSEAGQAVLKAIGGAANVDECVVGNFIASSASTTRPTWPGFFPCHRRRAGVQAVHVRVEGACGTGALALVTGIKSVLAETADVALADRRRGAEHGEGHLRRRHPGRCRVVQGAEGRTRLLLSGQVQRPGRRVFREVRPRARPARPWRKWFRNAVENGRLCPTAQEYTNTVKDLEAARPDRAQPASLSWINLNVFDCSKVSDGASAIAVVSEEGLMKCGHGGRGCHRGRRFRPGRKRISPPRRPT